MDSGLPRMDNFSDASSGENLARARHALRQAYRELYRRVMSLMLVAPSLPIDLPEPHDPVIEADRIKAWCAAAGAEDPSLAGENPFADVKGGNQRNVSRLGFVDPACVDQMVAASDDPDWKLLLLLERYGGLRLPSEVVRLKWQHIDFAREQILIHCTKTERYEGKETRYVPIFDELRQPLMDAYSERREPTDFVIDSLTHRTAGANLREQFKRVAKRAGVREWMKPFQNMRSTRETELIERLDLNRPVRSAEFRDHRPAALPTAAALIP